MDPVLVAAQAAAIIGLVQIAKAIGLPTKFAATAALVIGAVLVTAGGMVPRINEILIGLSAAGLYTIASEIGGGPSTSFVRDVVIDDANS